MDARCMSSRSAIASAATRSSRSPTTPRPSAAASCVTACACPDVSPQSSDSHCPGALDRLHAANFGEYLVRQRASIGIVHAHHADGVLVVAAEREVGDV